MFCSSGYSSILILILPESPLPAVYDADNSTVRVGTGTSAFLAGSVLQLIGRGPLYLGPRRKSAARDSSQSILKCLDHSKKPAQTPAQNQLDGKCSTGVIRTKQHSFAKVSYNVEDTLNQRTLTCICCQNRLMNLAWRPEAIASLDHRGEEF